MNTPGAFVPSVGTALLVGYGLVVMFAYAVKTAIHGRQVHPRVAKVGGSRLLGIWFVDAFYWGFTLPAEMFLRLRVSPDALTWTSLFVTGASGVVAATGHFSIAAVLLAAGAAFDAFDGYVARKRGIGSDCGEMLDAVVDRYADGAALIGLAVFYRFSAWQMLLPLAALMGSMLMSYVRAKAEAMDLELPGGLMRRHERIVYLLIALAIGPELSRWLGTPGGAVHPATLATLAFLGIMSNYAAFQLLFAGRRELVRLGRGPKESR